MVKEMSKNTSDPALGKFTSKGGVLIPWVVKDNKQDYIDATAHQWRGHQPPTYLGELWKSRHPGWRAEIPDKGALKYWWRGQGAAWLVRFNAETLSAMRALRAHPSALTVLQGGNSSDGDGLSGGRVSAAAVHAASAFPLPPGTVSVHIRHGDKHREMTLVPLFNYLEAANSLVDENTLGYSGKVLFLSTEDPAAVADLETTGFWSWEASAAAGGKLDPVNVVPDKVEAAVYQPPFARWTYLISKHPFLPRENSNGPLQMKTFQKNLSPGQLTLRWWLQLFMALECDAWVGTRGSNWNRLIDELRCIWLPKCGRVYREVGIKPADYLDYGW